LSQKQKKTKTNGTKKSLLKNEKLKKKIS